MKKLNIYMLIFLTVFLSIVVFGVNYGATEENDPLVTQSYVEMRLEQIKVYLEEKINSLSTRVDVLEQNGSSSSNVGIDVFKPIELKLGNKLIGGEGTEIILRVGNAKAITSNQGGIPDVTSGIDIQENDDIPKQHHLIIPRNDGRGIRIISNTAYVMVKGKYEIQ